jgi:hypothetical protein
MLFALPTCVLGDAHWIQTKSPAYQVITDAPPKAAKTTLADLEQFRFALGQVVGKELKLEPPLQALLFKDAAELHNEGVAEGIVEGRAHTMLVGVAGESLGAAAWKQVARLLISRNVARLPEDYERGIEAFFSTVQVSGAKVTWGALPAPAERTRDWARVHMLAVTPEYSGRLRVLFFNLQRGIPPDAAWPNAYGKSAIEMEREVDAYFRAGRFGTGDGPSTALSPDRDFYIKDFAGPQVTLLRADLLTSQSPGLYQQMLQANQNVAEAEDGLGWIAQRAGDANAARQHWKKAIDAGSTNDRMLVAYARIEKQPAPARAALDEAVRLNPNSAEAHFLLGEKASEPLRRSREYETATRLAPQNLQYWEALARWQVDQKQFVAAAKSWTAAEQAALNEADREKMHSARMAIEGQRLDYEEAEQQRTAAVKQAAINKLKEQALAELHAVESKANHGRGPGGANAPVMEWPDDAAPTGKAEGTLLRVECSGKTARLVIQTSNSKTLRLAIPDVAQSGLSCGPGKARRLEVEFTPKVKKRTGTDGVLATVTFH